MTEAEGAARGFAWWWTATFSRAIVAALFVWGGYWLAITVLQWHVASLPQTTPAQVGLLYFIQLSPMLLLTPFVGPLLDRIGGRPVLVAAGLFMAVVSAAGLALGIAGMLGFGASAVLSACLGLCMAVGSPAVHAFVPTTVSPYGLGPAVRSVAVSQNIARLIGPAAAGALLLQVGVPHSLVAVTAAAVMGALLLVRAPLLVNPGLVPPAADSDGVAAGPGIQRLFSGFRIAFALPLARRALLLTLANSVLSLSHVSMLPLIATDVLRVGEGGYAAMMAAGGAGAMLGALLPLRMRTLRPISALFVLSAAALAFLALAASLPFAVAASGVLGALGVMVAISLNVHLQAGIGHEVRGRVMSLFTWAWGGFLPIGGLFLGFVAGNFSVETALLSAAVLLVCVAAANAALGRIR